MSTTTTHALRHIRTNILKLKQPELADELGISVRTLARYEKKNSAPAPIAKLLDVIVQRHLKANPPARPPVRRP